MNKGITLTSAALPAVALNVRDLEQLARANSYAAVEEATALMAHRAHRPGVWLEGFRSASMAPVNMKIIRALRVCVWRQTERTISALLSARPQTMPAPHVPATRLEEQDC
jgi:hypothetical protein